MPRRKDTHPSMHDLFVARLDDIVRRAERVGFTLTDICRDTKISRQTPGRWRTEAPATIAKLDEMDKWVADRESNIKRDLGAD